MLPNEALYAIIGVLLLFVFKDVLWGAVRQIGSGHTLTLTEMSALKAQIRSIEEKQSMHDGILVAVTELKTEVRLMREAAKDQAPLIAGVVSETIKATLQFVKVPRAAAHAA